MCVRTSPVYVLASPGSQFKRHFMSLQPSPSTTTLTGLWL